MELLACTTALQNIPDHMIMRAVTRIIIFTDSQYVRDHFVRALTSWPANGWRNRYGKPIENVKLWKDLVRAVKKAPRKVEFKWVKGHSKNAHNKAVDKLAKQSANGFLNESLTVSAVRRKITTESVSIGSVRMKGQELNIRVITDKRMREQKIWRYKFEVLQSDSPDSGLVDVIYSEHQLRAAHSYKVRVCSDQKNPEIVEVIEEIEKLAKDGE